MVAGLQPHKTRRMAGSIGQLSRRIHGTLATAFRATGHPFKRKRDRYVSCRIDPEPFDPPTYFFLENNTAKLTLMEAPHTASAARAALACAEDFLTPRRRVGGRISGASPLPASCRPAWKMSPPCRHQKSFVKNCSRLLAADTRTAIQQLYLAIANSKLACA